MGDCESHLAAFLVGAGKNAYWGQGGWVLPNATEINGRWMPELFERPLGEPLADAIYDTASASWARRFASGTSVSFSARTGTGTIAWAK